MAKVNFNNDEFKEIMTHIKKSEKIIDETMDKDWKTNFANSYNNIVTSGFLDALYDDAKSDFYKLFGTGSLIVGASGAAVSGTCAVAVSSGVTLAGVAACIPVAGWIISAVILGLVAAIGIVTLVKSAADVQFKEDSKNELKRLLESCYSNNHSSYLAMEDLDTKLKNAYNSLQKVKLLIAEYNEQYASLTDSAKKFDLKLQLGDDGYTVKGVDTEVEINGKKVKVSVSEAMNAFYTYSNTVMASEIEADYLARTYGLDFDYTSLVNNANGFMQSTLNSGLYTHEFIDYILPEYDVSQKEAIDLAAGSLGITSSAFQSALDNNESIVGAVGAAAGIIGASFIGKAISGVGPNAAKSPGSTGGNVGGTGTNKGNSTISGNSTQNDQTVTNKKDEEDKKKKDNEKERENKIEDNIEIVELVQDEMPLEIENELREKDYDRMARDSYEETDLKEIEEHRNEITTSVNEAFDSGNLDEIKEKLKEYGYNDADIEQIVSDRDSLLTAMLVGDEKQILKDLANKYAEADEVKDFDTIYDDEPKYSDIIDGTESTLLVNTNTNDKVVLAKQELNDITEQYKIKVNETNDLLGQINSKKKDLTSIYEEYSNKNTTDYSKWSKEEIEEYSFKVREYNGLVEEANQKINDVRNLKEDYDAINNKYETIREEFLADIKKQNDRSSTIDTNVNANNEEIIDNNVTDSTDTEEDTTFTDEDALNAIKFD